MGANDADQPPTLLPFSFPLSEKLLPRPHSICQVGKQLEQLQTADTGKALMGPGQSAGSPPPWPWVQQPWAQRDSQHHKTSLGPRAGHSPLSSLCPSVRPPSSRPHLELGRSSPGLKLNQRDLRYLLVHELKVRTTPLCFLVSTQGLTTYS